MSLEMSQQRELATGAREATPTLLRLGMEGTPLVPLTGRSAKCGIGQ